MIESQKKKGIKLKKYYLCKKKKKEKFHHQQKSKVKKDKCKKKKKKGKKSIKNIKSKEVRKSINQRNIEVKKESLIIPLLSVPSICCARRISSKIASNSDAIFDHVILILFLFFFSFFFFLVEPLKISEN